MRGCGTRKGAARTFQLLADGSAQGGRASVRRVPRDALLQGLNAGCDNGRWRVEVWLACRQANDLRRQGSKARGRLRRLPAPSSRNKGPLPQLFVLKCSTHVYALLLHGGGEIRERHCLAWLDRRQERIEGHIHTDCWGRHLGCCVCRHVRDSSMAA